MSLLDRLRAARERRLWREAVRRLGVTSETMRNCGLTCDEAAAAIEDFAARWQEATKGSRVIIGPPDG